MAAEEEIDSIATWFHRHERSVLQAIIFVGIEKLPEEAKTNLMSVIKARNYFLDDDVSIGITPEGEDRPKAVYLPEIVNGIVAYCKKNFSSTEALLKEGEKIREKKFEENSPSFSRDSSRFATILSAMEKYLEAKEPDQKLARETTNCLDQKAISPRQLAAAVVMTIGPEEAAEIKKTDFHEFSEAKIENRISRAMKMHVSENTVRSLEELAQTAQVGLKDIKAFQGLFLFGAFSLLFAEGSVRPQAFSQAIKIFRTKIARHEIESDTGLGEGLKRHFVSEGEPPIDGLAVNQEPPLNI